MNDNFDAPSELPDDMSFPVGAKVKVVSGVFEQLTGTVDGHDLRRRRLRILLHLFGRTNQVDVAVKDVVREK